MSEKYQKSTRCCRVGCNNAAVMRPKLFFWAVGCPKIPDQAAVIKMFGLQLCHKHVREATSDDIVTDETWDEVCAATLARGLAPPDRASLELKWEPVK